jgi:hypothetical protein
VIDTGEVKRLLALEEDTLFKSLEKDPSFQAFGSAPNNSDDDGEFARSFFQSKISEMRKQLCERPVVRRHIEDSGSVVDDELICTVADVVLLFLGGVPAVYVVALALKKGLKKICMG